MANVTFGPDGTLYGTTTAGGEGFGIVFNLRPQPTFCKTLLCPWTETVLYRFTGGRDGGFALGFSFADALIFDQAGNIYGTAPSAELQEMVWFLNSPTRSKAGVKACCELHRRK